MKLSQAYALKKMREKADNLGIIPRKCKSLHLMINAAKPGLVIAHMGENPLEWNTWFFFDVLKKITTFPNSEPVFFFRRMVYVSRPAVDDHLSYYDTKQGNAFAVMSTWGAKPRAIFYEDVMNLFSAKFL